MKMDLNFAIPYVAFRSLICFINRLNYPLPLPIAIGTMKLKPYPQRIKRLTKNIKLIELT